MKKLLFMFALVCMVLTSCSNEDVSPAPEAKAQEAALSAYKYDPTITRLTAFNDSLITSQPASRSLWSFFKKVCSIASADIKGAVAGYKKGCEEWTNQYGLWGNEIGGVAGAIVDGIGASKLAFDNEFHSKSILTCSQTDIEQAYVYTICSPDFEVNPDALGEPWVIKIPEEFHSCVELGIIHNLTLNTLRNNESSIGQVDISNGFTDQQIAVIHSETFQNHFIEYMSDSSSFSMEYIFSNYCKEEYIVKLFLDLYTQYPENLYDVNYIISEYIDIIENDSSITSGQKQAIYIAISVAGYSSQYWNNVLKGDE